MSGRPLVRIAGASIAFGDNRALRGVDLDLEAGQVMGLVGENGSGKSTLIKILNGVYRPDRATRIEVRGERADPSADPSAFRRLGFSFVHQDLGLVPSLSVTENLLRMRIAHARRPWIGWRRLHADARAMLTRYGVDVDVRAAVSELGATERALVAIVRAVEELGDERTLLVLDEPTVFLPASGTELLFSVVRRLAEEEGMAILLVSHDLDEVIREAHRITVLRQGEVAAAVDPRTATVADLGAAMVGRDVSGSRPSRSPRGGDALAARGLASGRARGVDLRVAAGEVVGVTGLAGSGFEDVLPALYGAAPATGSVAVDGEPLSLGDPGAALRRGIVYVPADRKTEGGAPEMTVAENAATQALRAVAGPLGITGARTRAFGEAFVGRHDVRPGDPRKEFRLLSGGNQQKVVVGKWLDTDPRVVLLQDPTQGVDVGARAQINARLIAAADRGTAIVCATTDYEQLALICDRVLVMHDGAVVDEIAGADVERSEIALRVVRSSQAPVAA